VGEYRVRCFLSKNWQLRDAVLYKISMLLPSFDVNPGFESAAPALCNMIASSIDDRVTKVFLTSLIVLDDVLHEMEKSDMSPKACVPLLDTIILTLISKLADRTKPSVVEGAANMLFNFALSSCVGHQHLGGHALKAMGDKESKAPKTVEQRFELIIKLITEFGDEACNGRKTMDFMKGLKAFTHKDDGVRKKTKELCILIYKSLLGRDIMEYLTSSELSTRVLREYRVEFDRVSVVEGIVAINNLKDEEEALKSESDQKERDEKEARQKSVIATNSAKKEKAAEKILEKQQSSSSSSSYFNNDKETPEKKLVGGSRKASPRLVEKGGAASVSPAPTSQPSRGRGRGGAPGAKKGTVGEVVDTKKETVVAEKEEEEVEDEEEEEEEEAEEEEDDEEEADEDEEEEEEEEVKDPEEDDDNEPEEPVDEVEPEEEEEEGEPPTSDGDDKDKSGDESEELEQP
jgi:hypothetical protein